MIWFSCLHFRSCSSRKNNLIIFLIHDTECPAYRNIYHELWPFASPSVRNITHCKIGDRVVISMNLKHNYRIASFKVCLISEKFSSSFVKGKIKIIRGNLNRNPDKKPEILRSLCSSIRFPSLIKQNGLLKFGQRKEKRKSHQLIYFQWTLISREPIQTHFQIPFE